MNDIEQSKLAETVPNEPLLRQLVEARSVEMWEAYFSSAIKELGRILRQYDIDKNTNFKNAILNLSGSLNNLQKSISLFKENPEALSGEQIAQIREVQKELLEVFYRELKGVEGVLEEGNKEEARRESEGDPAESDELVSTDESSEGEPSDGESSASASPTPPTSVEVDSPAPVAEVKAEPEGGEGDMGDGPEETDGTGDVSGEPDGSGVKAGEAAGVRTRSFSPRPRGVEASSISSGRPVPKTRLRAPVEDYTGKTSEGWGGGSTLDTATDPSVKAEVDEAPITPEPVAEKDQNTEMESLLKQIKRLKDRTKNIREDKGFETYNEARADLPGFKEARSGLNEMEKILKAGLAGSDPVSKEDLEEIRHQVAVAIVEARKYGTELTKEEIEIGKEYWVSRSDGGYTLAKLTYIKNTGQYVMEWSEDGVACSKDVTLDMLSRNDPSKIEKNTENTTVGYKEMLELRNDYKEKKSLYHEALSAKAKTDLENRKGLRRLFGLKPKDDGSPESEELLALHNGFLESENIYLTTLQKSLQERAKEERSRVTSKKLIKETPYLSEPETSVEQTENRYGRMAFNRFIKSEQEARLEIQAEQLDKSRNAVYRYTMNTVKDHPKATKVGLMAVGGSVAYVSGIGLGAWAIRTATGAVVGLVTGGTTKKVLDKTFVQKSRNRLEAQTRESAGQLGQASTDKLRQEYQVGADKVRRSERIRNTVALGVAGASSFGTNMTVNSQIDGGWNGVPKMLSNVTSEAGKKLHEDGWVGLAGDIKALGGKAIDSNTWSGLIDGSRDWFGGGNAGGEGVSGDLGIGGEENINPSGSGAVVENGGEGVADGQMEHTAEDYMANHALSRDPNDYPVKPVSVEAGPQNSTTTVFEEREGLGLQYEAHNERLQNQEHLFTLNNTPKGDTVSEQVFAAWRAGELDHLGWVPSPDEMSSRDFLNRMNQFIDPASPDMMTPNEIKSMDIESGDFTKMPVGDRYNAVPLLDKMFPDTDAMSGEVEVDTAVTRPVARPDDLASFDVESVGTHGEAVSPMARPDNLDSLNNTNTAEVVDGSKTPARPVAAPSEAIAGGEVAVTKAEVTAGKPDTGAGLDLAPATEVKSGARVSEALFKDPRVENFSNASYVSNYSELAKAHPGLQLKPKLGDDVIARYIENNTNEVFDPKHLDNYLRNEARVAVAQDAFLKGISPKGAPLDILDRKLPDIIKNPKTLAVFDIVDVIKGLRDIIENDSNISTDQTVREIIRQGVLGDVIKFSSNVTGGSRQFIISPVNK
ncbi:hypothetical protein KC845_01500 [Candidatus Kaiserbacteria bacterium]|nr:hypothetical protein [Candidatus Kaiserbacteria bacterium]